MNGIQMNPTISSSRSFFNLFTYKQDFKRRKKKKHLKRINPEMKKTQKVIFLTT